MIVDHRSHIQTELEVFDGFVKRFVKLVIYQAVGVTPKSLINP